MFSVQFEGGGDFWVKPLFYKLFGVKIGVKKVFLACKKNRNML